MVTSPSGSTTPGIVADGRINQPPEAWPMRAYFIGSQYSNTSNTYQPDGTVLRNPDGTPQKKMDKWWKFNPLCKAEFAGGNDIYFGIRSAASQSIEEKIQAVTDLVNESGIRSKRAFLDPHAPRRAGATPGPGTAP